MTIKEIFEQADIGQEIKEITEALSSETDRINGMLAVRFISCEKEERTVTYEIPVFEWEANPNDVLHGGISAAMMDTTLGILANCICRHVGGYFSPTVSMNVNYLLPLPMNQKVIIKARLVSSGKSLLVLSGEAYAENSKALALTASATYMVMRKRN